MKNENFRISQTTCVHTSSNARTLQQYFHARLIKYVGETRVELHRSRQGSRHEAVDGDVAKRREKARSRRRL